MDDKTIICKDCGKDFAWTVREQDFYANQGFKPPVRCKDCRLKKKNERSRQWNGTDTNNRNVS